MTSPIATDATTPACRRTYLILRSTATILWNHPRLLWFPVLAALGTLAVVICGLFLVALFGASLGDPLLSGVFSGDVALADVHMRGQGIIGLACLYAIECIHIGAAVGLTFAAMEALSERSWSVEQALLWAHERRGAIFEYGVAAWVVGLLTGNRRGRRRGLFKRVVGLSWRAVTYLVIPVITRESRGAVSAIKRSTELLEDTWKEGAIGYLALRWMWVPLLLIATVPLGLCALLGVESPGIWVTVAVTSLALGTGGAVVLSTIETIFRAALYIFATEGVVPQPYDVDGLDCLWECRPKAQHSVDESDAAE